MSVATLNLNEEEKTIYNNIVELEKLGGSAAYLQAIDTASLLVRHSFDGNVTPFGLTASVPLTNLRIWSKTGLLQFVAQTQDGYSGSGTGAGYISTDLIVKDMGTLHYLTWSLMLKADSFVAAQPDGTGEITILFSAGKIPAGAIRVTIDAGTLAGAGYCEWKHT